jgi:hypothetical protein
MVMRYCSSIAAQRRGGNAKLILRRWRADIGVALAVRRARMARRCMPRVGARGRYILHGEVDDGPAGWRHAAGGLTAYVEAEPATFVDSDAEADEAAIIEADGDLLDDALESDDDP